MPDTEREFFIDDLLVRLHLIIMMTKWTGLAPWDFEFPFPGSLTSTFLAMRYILVNSRSACLFYRRRPRHPDEALVPPN